jgi:RNA polymerase sigma-70 factor, ECF subfamily
MDAQNAGEKVTRAYLAHRPYLVDLAFRMLGDIGMAEDVVQDAFWRLMQADRGEIEDERGWLIVVTSRLCLDHIKSARSRRERAHDASEIEYVAPAAARDGGGPLADPADRITFDDTVRLALLVMLERLSPSERVVFVLHDVFQMPFDEVADSVGRPVPTCRQLARRARQKIAASQEAARFDVPSAEHRQVTEKFIAACARGDLNGLVEVLAPDAWGDVDLGPDAARRPPVVAGAEHVARNLLHYWGQPATLVSLPALGQPALLGFFGRELAGVLVLTMRDELVQTVHVIGDPRKLAFLSGQLQA